ncbi:MAG TPA: outer membrane protein assembly factor BamD [Bryobacteraceae bacterium]|nr:outer membrane protein assembly factor BamD [Bryobacteraceae bacterium]
MFRFKNLIFRLAILALLCSLPGYSGFRRKKYENPITKDTQQPDKALFDKAISDLERSRYEVARITLQTLMNTYDTSEYLAKAKLAYADSWYREGGTHGLAQAEAEYKDFILFYPTLEEAAEAQQKVCMIHFKQMEKADRDMSQALRAEDECRNLLVQFPNSKFAPEAQQRLREIQEVIAEGEYRRGSFYHAKGSNPAAANRLQALTDQYPLYSQADQANLKLGDALSKMGPRYRQASGTAFARIVREYPLSPLVDDAKKRLTAMEMPIPEADQVAYARMKYELENRTKARVGSSALGLLKRGPDVRMAAKSGSPAMTPLRPTVPASVPTVTATPGTPGFAGEVTAAPVTDTTLLESQPDARKTPPAADAATPAGTAPAVEAPAANADQQPLPTNRTGKPAKQKKQKKSKSQ